MERHQKIVGSNGTGVADIACQVTAELDAPKVSRFHWKLSREN
jgi:hypothetical protein